MVSVWNEVRFIEWSDYETHVYKCKRDNRMIRSDVWCMETWWCHRGWGTRDVMRMRRHEVAVASSMKLATSCVTGWHHDVTESDVASSVKFATSWAMEWRHDGYTVFNMVIAYNSGFYYLITEKFFRTKLHPVIGVGHHHCTV